MQYISTDIPAGMTAAQYRRSLPRKPTIWQAVASKLRAATTR